MLCIYIYCFGGLVRLHEHLFWIYGRLLLVYVENWSPRRAEPSLYVYVDFDFFWSEDLHCVNAWDCRIARWDSRRTFCFLFFFFLFWHSGSGGGITHDMIVVFFFLRERN